MKLQTVLFLFFSKFCASKSGVRLIYGCGLYTDVYGTPPAPNITLMTDSSLKGWRGVIEGTPNLTGGRWSYQESKFHINYLELKAILLALRSLCNHIQCCHIKLLCDNTTAASYIRNMGGTKSRVCNEVTREIIMWCMAMPLRLSVSHLPGKLNVEADRASRNFHNSNTEWSSAPSVFDELNAKWGEPDMDMFASRLNYKVSQYVCCLETRSSCNSH